VGAIRRLASIDSLDRALDWEVDTLESALRESNHSDSIAAGGRRMRILRLVPALALLGLSMPAPPLCAEVLTTLQFFGPLGPDQTFTDSDLRIVSDSRTRNDSTARASAASSADIGTGELAAKATGELLIPSETGIAARAVGTAVDTLTINGPGTEAIPVTFEMVVDGDLIVPDSATESGNAFATVQALLEINGDSETATLQWRRTYNASGTLISDTLTGIGDWLGEQPVAGTTNHFELLLAFDTEIVPGAPFDFESELRAIVGSSGAVGADSVSDFGNTGRFTVILPPEYSLTSASGVFLAGPIPEPQVWAMFAGGLAWLALMAARRSRDPSPAAARARLTQPG
jgi:hypothetical protein